MPTWGPALLGLALTCAAAVGLLALGPRPPIPVAVAIALILCAYRAPDLAVRRVRIAPKTSPPRA